MITRFYKNLENYLEPNKVLIIYGPRRVGKTTLLKDLLDKTSLKYRLDSGDDIRIQDVLSSRDFSKIKEYVGNNELIAIDEAQIIPDIGIGLKIIVDQIPGIRVIITGSSSFDLANSLGEPLVGRKRTIILFPIAELELIPIKSVFDIKNELEQRLIFGSYPEVITAESNEKRKLILDEIVNSYLYKDILSFEKIRKSRLLVDLVKLLALQVGNEASLREISVQLGVNVRTVERYIDLLEKSFIIYSLGSLHRNPRNEIRGKKKYYFYDNGIRNGVVSQFNSLNDRNDTGALWENYLFMERLKKCSYNALYGSRYFWRTYGKKEIDLVEEREGKLFGFEFKWGQSKEKKYAEFLENYKNAEFLIIDKSNYLDFIS